MRRTTWRTPRRALFALTGGGARTRASFYDLTRSAMLKYALQLRIGRMDGALVAYHNTGSLLAFEYVRRSEMDAYVFGSVAFADAAFRAVAAAAEVVCRVAVEGELGCAAAAAAAGGDRLKVVVEPLRSRRSVAVYVQLVNGRPTTDAVSLVPGDAFEVLSRLTPVPVDGAVVLDYLDALKRAYYYKSPLLRERAWTGKEGGSGG
eukprot:contig_41392_g9430